MTTDNRREMVALRNESERLMKRYCRLSLVAVLTCWSVSAVPDACAEETVRPNVLFIAIDDLRPALGSVDEFRYTNSQARRS